MLNSVRNDATSELQRKFKEAFLVMLVRNCNLQLLGWVTARRIGYKFGTELDGVVCSSGWCGHCYGCSCVQVQVCSGTSRAKSKI